MIPILASQENIKQVPEALTGSQKYWSFHMNFNGVSGRCQGLPDSV